MGYLDLLKGMNSEKCPPLPLPKPPKAPYVSFDSRDRARFPEIAPLVRPAGDPATVSRWWLVHYLDGAPVEVWTSPPATQAEILESRPDAVAAEPFNDDRAVSADHQPLEPEQRMTPLACSTCAHVYRSGCCGDPVAAGLSDLEGVIYYHPDGGNGCQNWKGTTQ